MAFRVDPKTADVAVKGSPIEDAGPGDPGAQAIPLRAGTVPFLLGIAPVQRRALPPVVLTNPLNVQVLTLGGGGDVWPVSVLEIDRREPGDPSAVRLYWPDGVVEGGGDANKLQERGPRRSRGASRARSPRQGPRFGLPFAVQVIYPARKAQVNLEIETYEVNVPLKDVAFRLPEFGKQGLEVREWRRE